MEGGVEAAVVEVGGVRHHVGPQFICGFPRANTPWDVLADAAHSRRASAHWIETALRLSRFVFADIDLANPAFGAVFSAE